MSVACLMASILITFYPEALSLLGILSSSSSIVKLQHLSILHLVLRCCISSRSAISSSSWHVSFGLAIQAVVHANLALKSFAPALRNWSPTCSVFPPSIPPKIRWQASTPQDLSPMSTNTSFPPSQCISMVHQTCELDLPLKAQNGSRCPTSDISWRH